MALWDKPEPSKTDTPTPGNPQPQAGTPATATQSTPSRAASAKERADMKESLVASGLTIEGKINGKGHVRVAGKFKGDIQIEGDLHIDADAKVEGQVNASEVIVTGDLQGNIDNARHVELKQGSSIIGDIKANSFSVAAGARMRGNVDCGFKDGTSS